MPNDQATTERVERAAQKELEIADRLGGLDMYVDGEEDTDWVSLNGRIQQRFSVLVISELL
jgi:hypothetical protein